MTLPAPPLPRNARASSTVTWVMVGACVFCSVCVALFVGSEPVSAVRALTDATSFDHEVVFQLRAPRAVLAALAGAALAASGAALQSTLRNSLAEPYLLGVSGGAALGATVAVVLGFSGATLLGTTVMPIAALVGGLLATLLVLSLGGARGERGKRSDRILLGGVVINTIAAGLVTVGKNLTREARTQELLHWLTGFLDLPGRGQLVVLSIYVTLGLALLLYDAPRLDVLVLGRDRATTLGIDARRVELRVFLAASIMTGAIVSQTGLIGFVGLVVPHAARFFVGPQMRRLLPVTMIVGATFLVLCDAVSRCSFRLFYTEVPVGAVTALLGGPVFLWLLKKR